MSGPGTETAPGQTTRFVVGHRYSDSQSAAPARLALRENGPAQ